MTDRTLTSERLALMQEAFERAIALEARDRAGYLESLDREDADLGSRVRSLLAAHERVGDPLAQPITAHATQLLDPSMDLRVGERVGAWEIVRLVGAGGMGVVYEATRADDHYKQRSAIKLLSRHVASEVTVQRFRRERQILASLQHPNIASLLDGGLTEDGQPYFVMEYVEGEPITRWCDQRSISIARRLELFTQVCAAVQYAHEHLVVHRDLKPGNILVAGDGTVKLLDFGIAKLMPSDPEEEPGDSPTTRLGARAYTPDYASPEQIQGGSVGTRSDVYALGVVLYELLTGVRPFELRGKSAADVERLVSNTTPARPSAAASEARARLVAERSAVRMRQRLGGDLDAIVLKALRKEPERRYGSADEFAVDLRRYLEARPVSARPDGAAYRMVKFVRRRRAEAAAIALAVISLTAGMVGVLMQGRAAERERARATDVTSFLTTMLRAADPSSFGRDVRVREVLDSAATRADDLSDRPAFEAEIRGIIGGTYLALGELELAEVQYRSALAAHDRDSPRGGRETAGALQRLSMALEFQGRYAEADSVLHRATEMFDRYGYESEMARADHLDARGRILTRLGEMAQAEPFFARALSILERSRPANDSALASAYANLGVVTSELGRNATAETLLVSAVAAARRAYGESHPLVAAVMSPLATVQERSGSIDAADSTYRATLVMRRDLLGDEHPDYAWTMFNYADFLLRVERYPEAADWSRRVLALRGNTLSDEHPAVSTAMGVLGRALSNLDSLVAGERWLRESLTLRRALYPPGHYLIASSESILGELLARAGRFQEAETHLLKGERDLVAARGERAPIIQDARLRLVRLYESWGKESEAANWRTKLEEARRGP